MAKIIAAINMTLDGFCDHTAVDPDEALHDHYTDLIRQGDVILYGRITYELMKYWQSVLEHPTGEHSMDNFAKAIDRIPKMVFSNTLQEVGWKSARLATHNLREEVSLLRQQYENILVGSRRLIVQLIRMQEIDELQLCIHPVIAGSGLPLFENVHDRIGLRLVATKTFAGGAVLCYYEMDEQRCA